MDNATLLALEDSIKSKEAELNRLNAQTIIYFSGSYSDSPLLKFSDRAREFDNKPEGSIREVLKKNRNVISTCAVCFFTVVTVLVCL